MTPTIDRSETLYFKDARSDKTYTVKMVQSTAEPTLVDVFVKFGRRGKTQQEQHKGCFVIATHLGEAETLYDELLKAKRAKGYKAEVGTAVRAVPASEVMDHPINSLLATDFIDGPGRKVISKLDDVPPGFEEFMPVSANYAIEPPHLKDHLRSNFWVEEKYDGSLYVARFYPDGRVTFKSRRESVDGTGACERTQQLAHIAKGSPALAYTMLLVEIVDAQGAHGRVNSVLLSNPEKAKARQEKDGYLRAMVFDCLWHKGNDVQGLHLSERRELANSVYGSWCQKVDSKFAQCVCLSPTYPVAEAVTLYRKIVAHGGEGVMLKDPNAIYGAGMYKCKKANDVSVVITGYTEGKGKYEGKIGAVVFSLFDPAKLKAPKLADRYVEVGQCSGMDDNTRDILTINQRQYIYTVMDVRCQPPDHPDEWNPREERLRHPRFVKFRPDLDPHQAAIEKCRQDFKRII